MLDNWPILHFLAIICTTTTLIVIYLTSSTMQNKYVYSYPFKNRIKAIDLRKEEIQRNEARLAASPLPDEEINPRSILTSFPNTPMPKTPLIRVMETINLSASDVEHFSTLQELSLVKPITEEHRQHTDLFPQE